MISIKLTNKEISYLKDLAKKRHYAKHPSFRDSSAITSHKNFEPHFLGILGEYAWGKYTNQSIDTFIYDVRDFGEDFKNTEVKAITYEGRGEPELKIPKEEFQSRTSVLLYVLVKIKKDFNQSIIPNEIQILGTISRKDFEKSKISKQYREGYPENFIVPLSKMNQTKKNVFVNLFSPYEECFPPGVLLSRPAGCRQGRMPGQIPMHREAACRPVCSIPISAMSSGSTIFLMSRCIFCIGGTTTSMWPDSPSAISWMGCSRVLKGRCQAWRTSRTTSPQPSLRYG